MIRSRPDAKLVLRGVMAAHSHTAEISVFIAGGSSSCNVSVSDGILPVEIT